MDQAILEEERDRFVGIAFEEIHYRKDLLGDCYPFELDPGRQALTARRGGSAVHPGRAVYLFCLLASAIRENRLQSIPELKPAEQQIADTFQVCACLAAGGYLNGEVSSFGFPRATGTGFYAALRTAFARFGFGRVRESNEIPDGFPTAVKDGGIDIIAWRNHPDGMPGKLYLIGQCASGLRWRDKSVVEYIQQLHGSWFTMPPAAHATPAMFIPFPLHHELPEPKGPYLQALKHRFGHEEQRFGIIFDRLRIAHFANISMSFAAEHQDRIDGCNRFSQVADWVHQTCRIAGLQADPRT